MAKKFSPENSKKVALEYFSREEAAYFLRISERKLDDLISNGKIPCHKLGNARTSRVLIKISDLRKYVDGQRME